MSCCEKFINGGPKNGRKMSDVKIWYNLLHNTMYEVYVRETVHLAEREHVQGTKDLHHTDGNTALHCNFHEINNTLE